MEKFAIQTEFENMYDTDITLFKCPCCGDSEICATNRGKWTTENFTRLTCLKCNTYIIIAGKNCDLSEL